MLRVGYYDLWCVGYSMGISVVGGAIYCIWSRLEASIGIGKMCKFL